MSLSPFTYEVFISYRSTDRPKAEALQARLTAAGLNVWRDDRLQKAAGASYLRTINEALDRSAKVVVLWSPQAAQSDWVIGEATRAGDRLIPILLEPTNLPAPFNHAQYLHWSNLQKDLNPLLQNLGARPIEGQPGFYTLLTPDYNLLKLPPTFADLLFGRDREMHDLQAAWDRQNVNVAAFDAIGGAGKTTLAVHFVRFLEASGWRGCKSAFAWSFYSQGSDEDKQASADEFFTAAFAHFGKSPQRAKAELEAWAEYERAKVELREAQELGLGNVEALKQRASVACERAEAWPPAEPHAKGQELARSIAAARNLLILDGLEPLQYAAGKAAGSGPKDQAGHQGGIKDQAVKALLQTLARENPGLCLVTTRLRLHEIDPKDYPHVLREELQPLDAAAGTALLRHRGVEPAFPKDQPLPVSVAREFAAAVHELEGHALALNLVGQYLVTHHGGRLRALHEVPDLRKLDAPSRRRTARRSGSCGPLRQICCAPLRRAPWPIPTPPLRRGNWPCSISWACSTARRR